MHSEIKQQIDEGKISQARYSMRFALELDPSGTSYAEDLKYCENANGFFEQHEELTPFRNDRSQWDNDYWNKLKSDLSDNYSRERYLHMLDVVKVVFSAKLKSINDARSAETARLEEKRKAEEKRIAEEKAKLEKQKAHSVITERSTGLSYRDEDGSQINLEQLQCSAENHTTKQPETQEPPKNSVAPIIIGAAVVGAVVAGVIIAVAVL